MSFTALVMGMLLSVNVTFTRPESGLSLIICYDSITDQVTLSKLISFIYYFRSKLINGRHNRKVSPFPSFRVFRLRK
jgi:hypothetical protein